MVPPVDVAGLVGTVSVGVPVFECVGDTTEEGIVPVEPTTGGVGAPTTVVSWTMMVVTPSLGSFDAFDGSSGFTIPARSPVPVVAAERVCSSRVLLVPWPNKSDNDRDGKIDVCERNDFGSDSDEVCFGVSLEIVEFVIMARFICRGK